MACLEIRAWSTTRTVTKRGDGLWLPSNAPHYATHELQAQAQQAIACTMRSSCPRDICSGAPSQAGAGARPAGRGGAGVRGGRPNPSGVWA